MNTPEITVYIPTHNRADLLRKAVESVLSQCFSNFELIVVNDGADSTTTQFLEDVSAKDSRVKYISYDDSKGACYARNLAINIAKGKYITGLDDDDLFSEGRLSELFENRELLETYSFISTGTLFIKNGKKVKTQFSDKALIDREAIVRGNAIGNQVFTLSERLKNINGFDVSLLCWQDYDAWIRLIFEYGSGYNLQSPTYIMNIDERKDRISLSKRKTSGIKVFLEKHSMCLTPRFKGKFKAFIFLFGNEGVSFSGVKERAFFKLYLFLYKIKK